MPIPVNQPYVAVMSASRTDDGRKGDLAAIHIAKAALEWDEDTYRDVMQAVIGARSAATLDPSDRKRWLTHLQTCLTRAGKAPPRKLARDYAGTKPWSPQLRQLWSLWQQLADAGLVRDRARPALQAWVTRQTGVDRLEWLKPQQLDGVLASARLWLKRKKEPACPAASD